MKKPLMLLPLLILAFSFGCAQNHFNVPEENYASRVRILGVAPILIDEESDIRHPQKEQLISLLAQLNRASERQLVTRLKETGNYYSVALLEGDPAPSCRTCSSAARGATTHPSSTTSISGRAMSCAAISAKTSWMRSC